MKKSSAPKDFSAYLITHSDHPQMEVGKVLIDKGKRLHMEWNTYNFETGEQTYTSGRRILRLCPTCRLEHSTVGSLGHDGECGTEAVRKEAQQEIAHAKKRADA